MRWSTAQKGGSLKRERRQNCPEYLRNETGFREERQICAAASSSRKTCTATSLVFLVGGRERKRGKSVSGRRNKASHAFLPGLEKKEGGPIRREAWGPMRPRSQKKGKRTILWRIAEKGRKKEISYCRERARKPTQEGYSEKDEEQRIVQKTIDVG